ncbi:MAG: hypothetical protein ABIG56_02510 [Candidatus Omnitrophota bacterium]
MKKPRFKPRIARVKLNPEQTVLTCTCYQPGPLGAYEVVENWAGLYTESPGPGGWVYCYGVRGTKLLQAGGSDTRYNLAPGSASS